VSSGGWPPEPDGLPARRRSRLPSRLGAALLVITLVAALGLWAASRGGRGQDSSAQTGGPATGAEAPGGTYTLLNGTQANLSALRGEPTMVWFVADGCASCAVSIPAVAQHLPAFTQARTRVLVLGLYGAFGLGAQGTAALASFGKTAAGESFTSPAWTWGLASQRLTTSLDPAGVPDAYYLIDSEGHITYQNSVPVSTIGDLLAHLDLAAGRSESSAATQRAAAPASPIP
jgi:hypothetical protein